MPPTVNLTSIPTGGAIRLDMPDYVLPASGVGSITISRGVSGSGTWTQLYSGAPLPMWLDVGDGLPAPLASGTPWIYQVTDGTGTVVTPAVTAGSTIVSTPDGLTELLLRLLQATCDNLALPPGIEHVQVTTQMPANGLQALPFIVVNLDLLQQEYAQIGQDVINPNQENLWSSTVLAGRIWRVSVFSRNAKERDYYRDTLLMAFQVLMPSAFAPMGLDVKHRFQASSGVDARGWEGKAPGFYFADLMLELSGTFNATLMTSYGLMETIQTQPSYPDGVTDTFTVPSSGAPA